MKGCDCWKDSKPTNTYMQTSDITITTSNMNNSNQSTMSNQSTSLCQNMFETVRSNSAIDVMSTTSDRMSEEVASSPIIKKKSKKKTREHCRFANHEQKLKWGVRAKKSSKTRESFFNGFCWLALVKRVDRQLATTLIGRWPTVARMRKVMEEEGIRFADGGFNAVFVQTDIISGVNSFTLYLALCQQQMC